MNFYFNFTGQADLPRPFPKRNISVSTDFYFQREDTSFEYAILYLCCLLKFAVT